MGAIGNFVTGAANAGYQLFGTQAIQQMRNDGDVLKAQRIEEIKQNYKIQDEDRAVAKADTQRAQEGAAFTGAIGAARNKALLDNVNKTYDLEDVDSEGNGTGSVSPAKSVDDLTDAVKSDPSVQPTDKQIHQGTVMALAGSGYVKLTDFIADQRAGTQDERFANKDKNDERRLTLAEQTQKDQFNRQLQATYVQMDRDRGREAADITRQRIIATKDALDGTKSDIMALERQLADMTLDPQKKTLIEGQLNAVRGEAKGLRLALTSYGIPVSPDSAKPTKPLNLADYMPGNNGGNTATNSPAVTASSKPAPVEPPDDSPQAAKDVGAQLDQARAELAAIQNTRAPGAIAGKKAIGEYQLKLATAKQRVTSLQQNYESLMSTSPRIGAFQKP